MGRWPFDEEINYELEMDIELIVSRLEEPHYYIRHGATASNQSNKVTLLISVNWENVKQCDRKLVVT